VPVISKPLGSRPVFGGKSVVMFGSIDKEAMRRWQERVGAAKSSRCQAAGAAERNSD